MRTQMTLVIASGAFCGLALLAAGAASNGAERPASIQQEPHPISKIELELKTGNRDGAGTDGDVFLGVAGREFFVDSQGDHDDFERNTTRTYVFGAGTNVQRASENDPRKPWQLDFNELIRTPRYIRFEPGGDWNVERINLRISAGGAVGMSLDVSRLDGSAHLWLGEKRGKVVYLP